MKKMTLRCLSLGGEKKKHHILPAPGDACSGRTSWLGWKPDPRSVFMMNE